MSEEDGQRALAAAFAGVGADDCKQTGCWELAKVRGLCGKHYQGARAAGAFGGAPCSEWPCKAVAVTRGYCRAHYYSARKAGEVKPLEKKPVLPCPGDGEGDVCWGEVKARGKCMNHYMKDRRKQKKAEKGL